MQDQTRFQRKDSLIATEMNGDRVMMDAEKGSYFALKGVGGFVWDFLETPQAKADIIAAVQSAYTTWDANKIDEDIERFLTSLVQAELVETVDG